jgi:anaerobic magnesium-protoporphyrin IX monomethyl ester cyclase
MKILLVNPPEASQNGFSNPPIGLAYLASTLEKNHFQVRIADGFLLGKEGVKDAINQFDPQIVGITCYTPGRLEAINIANVAKSLNRKIITVIGGAHATIMWKQILENYDFIDICVIGEGEQTLLEIAQGLPIENIAGIAYKKNNAVIKNKPREYIINLDDIPFPAWHLLDLNKYPIQDRKVVNGIDLSKELRISVIFTRGCIGNCSFCSTWWIWKNHRVRSAKNMVDELELLHTKYKIKHFVFADDEFSEDIKSTKELCKEIINRKLNIVWFATSRVDRVDKELLELMHQAGCYEISFGIESGSQKILDIIGKKTTVEQGKRAIYETLNAGIIPYPLLIVGNVGETKQTINETIDFLNEFDIKEFGHVGGLWVLPGTKLYQNFKKEGFIDDSYWLTDKPTPYYYKENSKKIIDRYVYALTTRNKIGTFEFWLGYSKIAKILRKLFSRFTLIRKLWLFIRKFN